MKYLKNTTTALFFLVFIFAYSVKSQTLLIYGGKGHDVFLGCLNCSKSEQKSIWNTYDEFGSKFNDKCIWNNYSTYGGKYSEYSPFNKNASYPPVIVDPEGNFYGYFTANKFKDKRTSVQLALFIIDYWESIREDVSTYYEKIFK